MVVTTTANSKTVIAYLICVWYNFRDAMLVPIINCGTSIFAGFVIFSVLGFMAHTAGTTVDEVVKQGDYDIFIISILSRFISVNWLFEEIFGIIPIIYKIVSI